MYNPEIDKAVAEAQGWTERQNVAWDEQINPDIMFFNMSKGVISFNEGYHPSTNWQQAGELQVKFNISVSPCMHKPKCGCDGWEAIIFTDREIYIGNGKTPQEAICKAVIAMHEGE